MNGAPSAPRRSTGVLPNAASRCAVAAWPNGSTSTGTGARVPSRSTSLSAPATTTKRRLDSATIFSRSSAPPSPLISRSVPRSISSAPSIARSSV
jgi:hypothetical protein